MVHYSVNPQKHFYNFQGKIPTATLGAQPAQIPPDSPHTQPKLITDTTLRDGAQDPRFAIFPNKSKLKYYDFLHTLDNGTGVIEAVEVFIYQDRDLWVLDRLLERDYEYPKVTTWTRATPKDIKLLSEVSQGRIKETGMLASSSDHHIFDKLSFRSKEEAIEKYLEPILTACKLGIRPRVHLEDATKADIYGWVIPFMRRVMEETKGQACFRICDTVGLGIPDPFATIPFGVPHLVSTLAREVGAELEFHGHNDFGLATANSIAAWTYGCKRVNCAFGGLGERTGNTPLEQVIANYIRLYGDPGFKLDVLIEIAELINSEVVPIPEKQPVIGTDIFTTQAGLHQTGVERHRRAEGGPIYLPYDPAVVGRNSIELSRVGSLAGMDGIVSVLNRAIQESTGEEGHYTVVSKTVKYIYDSVHKAYDGTYDAAQGRYVNYRATFFEPRELLTIAREYEAKRSSGS
ncbi:MAG: 2-isopropylmalate synthase [Chloroflexi bacterium]|nr:2-isopropylmalate synthase [Chloroflexota bacterium]